MSSTPAKSRVTTVQVPGAPAPEAAPAPAATVDKTPEPEAEPEAAASGTFKPTLDQAEMDAIRAHIREEERAILRDELSVQMQAASKAIEGTVGNSAAPRSKHDYANMRAKDIDHTTLTAPVRTLDGYLCPPAPEAKK